MQSEQICIQILNNIRKIIIFNIFSNLNIIMGLLTDLGLLLSFEETMEMQKELKRLGLFQFFYILRKYANWNKPVKVSQIKWGEEIQGHFLQFNQKNQLQLCKQNISKEYADLPFPLMFEYGSWMFEMIPNKPYNTQCNFNEIIYELRLKYEALHSKSKIALTIPVIPFLGVRDKANEKGFNNQITNSEYIDDDSITHHPRFPTLTKNIRLRRGKNVDINVPLFLDQNTSMQQIRESEPNQGFIHMDAMAFGMGLCCLQCTFSTINLDNARYIYDQMNVISPIFLALTAGSPFHKGKLSDWDVRWNIISASCDDRNENERNPKHKDYLPTSRYSSANYYIWNNEANLPEYNDFDTGVKEEDLKLVQQFAEQKDTKLDALLRFHLANIFKRDCLVAFKKFKDMSEEQYTIFQTLNSTNWNSVRLKIPIDQEIGWRVEFRTMEVQLTPDQNSAYSLFIHLMTRVFHQNGKLNLYIPITQLRENFDRAHKKDALRKEKFHFRTNIRDNGPPIIEELYISEILFGKQSFKGIFYEVEEGMESCVKMCDYVRLLFEDIKRFLFDVSTGKRLTLAQWMRGYIRNHKQYKKNSILEKIVMDDLMIQLDQISKGAKKDQNFYQIFHLKEENIKQKVNTDCQFEDQKEAAKVSCK